VAEHDLLDAEKWRSQESKGAAHLLLGGQQDGELCSVVDLKEAARPPMAEQQAKGW
jgi:hypothetical protein